MSDSSSDKHEFIGSGEIRERLRALEVFNNEQSREQIKSRDRIHDLTNQVARVIGFQEDAAETRKEILNKIDSITDKVDPLLISSAQLATSVALHNQQVIFEQKTQDEKIHQYEARLDKQETAQQQNFFLLDERIKKLENQMKWWIGASAAVVFILTVFFKIVFHA